MELKNIQERLREAIKLSGIPQKDLATAVGVSSQTISKYMRRNIFPALDTFAKLCKALDADPAYILGLSN
ncbi:MAG: helix-turn-helix domain-containing protein [Clostridia bacterium]|nr:helix-turn-helix domain-containing protein [Clostridia bacterium]